MNMLGQAMYRRRVRRRLWHKHRPIPIHPKLKRSFWSSDIRLAFALVCAALVIGAIAAALVWGLYIR